MPILKPGTIMPTEEEDKIITRKATEDGTLSDDEALANMRPMSDACPELHRRLVAAQKNGGLTARPVGRPKSDKPKQATTIRLSPEVIAFFKRDGKGWQSRIDKALQEYVRSQS